METLRLSWFISCYPSLRLYKSFGNGKDNQWLMIKSLTLHTTKDPHSVAKRVITRLQALVAHILKSFKLASSSLKIEQIIMH